MPDAPLPAHLGEFLEAPRAAIVAIARRDGSLTSAPMWYEWRDERIWLNTLKDGHRERNLRRNPQVAITVLADSWYSHVSLSGRVVEFRDDPDMAHADRLAMRYWGEPYPQRGIPCMSLVIEIDRWHTFQPPARAQAGSSVTPS